MNMKIALKALVIVIAFIAGVLLGHKLFYGTGCPETICIEATDNRPKNTDQALIDKYKIKNDYYSNIANQGYTVEKKDKKYIVSIYMGKRNTGGYYFVVRNVSKTSNNIEIIVDEISPARTDMVTEAITYPSVSLTVDSNKVIVKNMNNETYNLITQK